MGRLQILAALGSSALFGFSGSAQQPAADTVDKIVAAIAESEARQAVNLSRYSVTREYTVHSPRLNKHATMVVRVTYDSRGGKDFSLVSFTGSESIKSRIFDKVLATETETSKSPNGNTAQVSPQNYTFELLGSETVAGRECYLLGITAKSKKKYLVNGRIWVDKTDYAIVRLEGRTAGSISFWVGKADVIQEYEKIDSVWVAMRNRSRTSSALLGSSEFTVTVRQCVPIEEAEAFNVPTAHNRVPGLSQ